MLSKLFKRFCAVIKALIDSIKMAQIDIDYSGANLKTKRGRKIYMSCIKSIPDHFRLKMEKDANFSPINVSNEWSKVGKYKTKSFGEVDFNYIAEIFGVDVMHNKHQINLRFDGENINQKIIDICLNTVNNYFEINSTVKQTMLTAFQKYKSLQKFFKYCYYYFPRYESVRIFGKDEFKNINLEKVVKKLNFPDIRFTVENDNLTIGLCYHFDSDAPCVRSNALRVKMNEQLNILNYEHFEHLIS